MAWLAAEAPTAYVEQVSYTDAENHARNAETYARRARLATEDNAEQNIARSLEELAKAVAEMAATARRAS